MSRTLPLLTLAVCFVAELAGCSTAQTSNTARTATEQLLISNAIDHSLDKVDFRSFAGQSVFLEEKYVDCVDKAYLVGSVRHRILKAGGHLVDKAENADVVLEPRSGGVGTTSSSSFFGVPEVVLPGMLTLPEVRLLTRTRQSGYAKIGLAAYDAKSHETLGPGGMTLAQSDDSNYFVAGVGPFQSGTLKTDLQQATTGAAATIRDRVPPQVVFSAPHPPALPPAEKAETDVQITSGDEEAGKAVVRPSPFYPPAQ
jgi:hypothetical protein